MQKKWVIFSPFIYKNVWQSKWVCLSAAASEIFFELASQYVPKMALLSSIIIEKSIQKDYAGGSRQNFLLSISLIYSKNACFWRRYSIKYSQNTWPENTVDQENAMWISEEAQASRKTGGLKAFSLDM